MCVYERERTREYVFMYVFANVTAVDVDALMFVSSTKHFVVLTLITGK